MRELSVSATSEPGEDLELVDAAAQVSAWCGEPLLYDGDDPALTLAPGTARRRALDAALDEIAQGLDAPSPAWRFRFSLMLGLERVLAADQPALLNGLTLRPHQVDALAGMLAALTSAEEREDAEEDELNGVDELVDEAAEDEADEADDVEEDDEDEDEEIDDEVDAEVESTPTRMTAPTRTAPLPRSPRSRRSRSAPAVRTRARRPRPRPTPSRSSTIRARSAATASSTRPHRARPLPQPGSSRPAAPSACSS